MADATCSRRRSPVGSPITTAWSPPQELRAVGVGPNGHRTAVSTAACLRRVDPRRRSSRRWPRRRWSTGAACCVASIPPASSRDRPPACSAGLRRQPTVGGSALLDPSRGAPRRGCRRRVSPDHGARASATERCAPTGSSSPSFPRLAFDLAADLRQLDHRSVVQQLLDRRLVTVDELAGDRSAPLPSRPPRQHDVPPDPARPRRRTVTTRIPRSSSTTRSGAGSARDAQVPVDAGRWRDDPRRPRRGGGAVGDRARHPSRASERRRPPPGQRRVRSMHGTDWQIEPVSELDMTAPTTARRRARRALPPRGIRGFGGRPGATARASVASPGTRMGRG